MSDSDKDVEAITELERQRFEAVVAGDFDVFASVCHPDLMYTHSNGVTDTLAEYLAKCRDGFYVYHQSTTRSRRSSSCMTPRSYSVR